MSMSLVISIGESSATFMLEWAFWTSLFGFTVSLLVFSYKFGYRKGQQETCHDQYSLGLEKGKDFADESRYKIGFSDGRHDFFKSTKIVDSVNCNYHPEKNPLLNGISLIKQNDGKTIDVECPYLQNDKTCQNTNIRCEKID